MFGLEKILLFGTVFLSSSFFLWAFYHSKFFSHLDVPNHRSMHEYPTKKSAGLVFVSVFILSLFYLVLHSGKSGADLDLLFRTVPGLLVLLTIGFLDDRYNFSSRRKLFFEIIFFVPYCFIFFPDFQLFSFSPDVPKIFYSILLAGYIIFVTNLCNFMDGLDLYLTLSTFSALVLFLLLSRGIPEINQTVIFLLGISLASFVFFNFPPARLFMGDTGSLPLGYMISILPFLGNSNHPIDLGYVFLFIPVFWVDGVLTILIRLYRKENIFRAHREHLYQKITLHSLDKRITTILFSAWNLLSIPIILYFKEPIPLLLITLIVIGINALIYIILIRRV